MLKRSPSWTTLGAETLSTSTSGPLALGSGTTSTSHPARLQQTRLGDGVAAGLLAVREQHHPRPVAGRQQVGGQAQAGGQIRAVGRHGRVGRAGAGAGGASWVRPCSTAAPRAVLTTA